MFCYNCGTALKNHQYKFCPSCGSPKKNELAATVEVQPSPKKSKLARNILLGIFGAFLLLIIISALHTDSTQTTADTAATSTTATVHSAPTRVAMASATSEPSAASTLETSSMPADERAFIRAVQNSQAAYSDQPNEMAKGGIRTQRRAAICRSLTGLKVSDWVGHIETLNSNGDGKGVLEIALTDSITLKTWNNDFSDIGSDTLIDPNSTLFATVSRMHTGDRVTFSGTFMPSDVDCVKETSLTLDGSMSSPDFLFRFSAVE